MLLGVPLGAWVATNFSWRWDYGAIAAMAAAASVALYLKLPRGMVGDTQSIGERLRVLGNKGVGPALLTTLLFMVAAYPPLIFVGAVMDGAAIARELLPFALLANGVGAVAASMSAGRIADRLGNRMAGMGAMVLQLGVLGVVVSPSLPVELRPAVLFAALVLMGYVGWGFWIAHCSEMARLAPSAVPVAISLDLTALNLGIAIAAGLGGVVIDRWGVTVLCMAVVPVGLTGLALWAAQPARTE